jgi:sec-independent protein translocase protein TatA
MFNNIGPSELIIIALVLVVLFGSKRLTEMAGQLGEASKEIKKAKHEYEKVANGQPEEVLEEKAKKEVKEVDKPESKEVDEDA